MDTINTAIVPSFIFANQASLSVASMEAVRSSLQVGNTQPILGDSESLTGEEVRMRAYATFASQNRAVTAADYVNLSYRMPAKFGSVKRVALIQDVNSFKRNLNMYVLAEDSKGDFIAPNFTLKTNLKTWLGARRMINDTIDILDGRIINYGVNFEVLPELDINKYELLQRCTEKLKDKLKVKKGIGDPVYISEIYKFLNDVPGVVDTTNVELVNKAGGLYSNYIYSVDNNLSDDGRYWIVPRSAAPEILFPNSDITGVVK